MKKIAIKLIILSLLISFVPSQPASALFLNKKDKNIKLELEIKQWTKVLQEDIYYPSAYYERGKLREQCGDVKGAIFDYSSAIGLEPNWVDFYYSRANAYKKLRQKKEAIRDYLFVKKYYEKLGLFYNDKYLDSLKAIQILSR